MMLFYILTDRQVNSVFMNMFSERHTIPARV